MKATAKVDPDKPCLSKLKWIHSPPFCADASSFPCFFLGFWEVFLIFSRSTCSSFQAVAEDLDDLQAGLDAAVRLLKTDRHSTKWLNVRLRPLYAANTGVRWMAPRILAGCSSFLVLVEETPIIYIYIYTKHSQNADFDPMEVVFFSSL